MSVIEAAVFCMALAVYHEARGEPVAGQIMVAQVALNRADGNTNQVCKEVFRHKQFSSANEKVVKTRRGWALHESLRPTDLKAWARAQHVALAVLQHAKQGTTTHFRLGERKAQVGGAMSAAGNADRSPRLLQAGVTRQV